MDKCTKGPWVAGQIKGHPWHVQTPDGKVMIFGTSMRGTSEQQGANAQLMAAAPELFQAVQLVLGIHDNPDQQSHPIELDPIVEKQLRQAVAKAKGKK